MNSTLSQERIYSLQAGIFAAITAGFVWGFTGLIPLDLLLETWIKIPVLSTIIPALQDLLIHADDRIEVAIACINGFLFGVTYRYIIRTDSNVQLKLGAVLAFSLVRALSQIEVGLILGGNIKLFLILIGKSLLLFAITSVVLEGAIAQGWIKRFASIPD
jgi:hypothetical protein